MKLTIGTLTLFTASTALAQEAPKVMQVPRLRSVARQLHNHAAKEGPLEDEANIAKKELNEFARQNNTFSMGRATEAPSMPPNAAPTTPAPVTPAPVGTPAPVTPAPVGTPAPVVANKCNIDPVLRSEQLLTILTGVNDEKDLTDKKSTAGMAFDWLVNQDEYYICPDDTKVVQRYVMAKMYFQTNGDQWLQCGVGGVCAPTVADYQGDNWLASSNECDWAFIQCNDDNCITHIEVDENNVSGTLVDEIDQLQDLIVFTMDGSPNNLKGTIPTQFGNLPNLEILDLDENALTGTVPEELYLGAPKLQQLDLDSNDLEGTISSNIGNLTDLNFVQFFNNPKITGTIPESMANLNKLETLGLYGMGLTGTADFLCDLRTTNGGELEFLWTDCGIRGDGTAQVSCTCCDFCATGR